MILQNLILKTLKTTFGLQANMAYLKFTEKAG